MHRERPPSRVCPHTRTHQRGPLRVQACWRNVYLNGHFEDALQTDPLTYDLPRAGILALDFVSYNLPGLKHADLLARVTCPRASTFRVKPEAPPHDGGAVERAARVSVREAGGKGALCRGLCRIWGSNLTLHGAL